MNDLQIIKNDIDWLKIIEMALNRQGWGKIYTLYHCDDVQISCYMTSFDFTKNKATFCVTCKYKYQNVVYDEDEYDNKTSVEYFLSNFSINDFKLVMNKNIIWFLNRIIERRTKSIAESKYDELYLGHWQIQLEKHAKEVGLEEDLEIIMALTDNDLQDNCISELKNKIQEIKNREYYECVEEYTRNNKIDIPNMNLIIKELHTLNEEMIK